MSDSLVLAKMDGDPRCLGAAAIDYASAVKACPSGILVTDPTKPDNPIIFVNPAFMEVTGYSFTEAIGRNCRFLQGPDTDREAIAEIGLAVARGLPIRKEILNYRKDGEQFWNDLAINPIVDAAGKLSSFVGILTDITERKRAVAMREEAEARISRIVSHMPGFVFRRTVGADGAIRTTISSNPFAMWEPGTPLTLGKYREQVIHPNDREKVRHAISRSIADVAPITMEFRAIGDDGKQRWFRTSATPHREMNGDVVWDGVGIDISKEKTSQERLSGIAENMPGYVFQRVRKPDGTIAYPYVSPSFGRLIALPAGTRAPGEEPWAAVHPDDREKLRESIEKSAETLSQFVLEYRLIPNNSQVKWMRCYSTARQEENGDVVWDCVAVDITAEKEIEVRLAYLAHHDPLTGLANRALLTERLATAIKAARESSGEVVVSHLLIVDFSEINETLGADDGDSVLKSAGTRINELSLLDRNTVVARVGNAEFAILRHGGAVGANANEFVDALIRNIAQPILIGTEPVAIEPCIGTATFRKGDLSHLSADMAAAEMLKRGAIALSAAAKAGPGAHRLYDEELDHRTRHRMMLRHSMRHAIEQDQFELHYQPLVELRSGRIVSAEALIRWRHPEFGLLRPDLFISLAEESGLIGALGEWVMRRAMRQVSEWKSKGLTPPKIALNVSGVQIGMPNFIETVRKAVTETGADASRFELELTEGILVERSLDTLSVLADLKSLGFELVIDDFGAGHSNFQYLRNFPVDKLKIDQIFVRQLVTDSNDALIIRAIASLARSLGLALVAEGIETREQRDFLRDQGCPIGQGYFFSLPLAAEDFGWMIENSVELPMSPSKSQKRGNQTARGQP